MESAKNELKIFSENDIKRILNSYQIACQLKWNKETVPNAIEWWSNMMHYENKITSIDLQKFYAYMNRDIKSMTNDDYTKNICNTRSLNVLDANFNYVWEFYLYAFIYPNHLTRRKQVGKRTYLDLIDFADESTRKLFPGFNMKYIFSNENITSKFIGQ